MPASGLVLCSGEDAVDGDRSCSDTAPLSPPFAACGPPVKIRPGSLYYGAALIAPEDGNNRRIWRSPCCGHRCSGCCPRHNCLTTKAYHWLIIPDGQNYRERKAFPKVRQYSRDNSGLPLGWFYRSTLEVAISAGVVLTGLVVVDPLSIVTFWGFFVIPPHKWVWPILWIPDFPLNYLDKRSYHHHLSSLFLSQHNGIFSPQPLLIFMFWSFYMMTCYGWLQPLIGITYSIGSTLFGDHILTLLIWWSMIPF